MPSNYVPIQGEEWKTFVRAPDYEVSNKGRMKSFRWSRRYATNDRILTGSKNPDGYLRFVLKYPGKNIYITMAQAVAEVWIGPRPKGRVVCHKDGDLNNNNVENLEYKTQKENTHDKFAHGTMLRGEDSGNAKLTEDKVREIIASKESTRSLAKRMGVTLHPIRMIKKGLAWRHVPR